MGLRQSDLQIAAFQAGAVEQVSLDGAPLLVHRYERKLPGYGHRAVLPLLLVQCRNNIVGAPGELHLHRQSAGVEAVFEQPC